MLISKKIIKKRNDGDKVSWSRGPTFTQIIGSAALASAVTEAKVYKPAYQK